MLRFGSVLSALLLQASQPVVIVPATAVTITSILQMPAQAQSIESVAKVAKAITVRIEGATQGSGVIVGREGNVYTVLTAWHVIQDNRPGEEIAIFTPDGTTHPFQESSIKRLPDIDLAIIQFESTKDYESSSFGEISKIASGQTIFVSGFPLPTSSVPYPIWRFVRGDVIANASTSIPGGYQLLYSNPTLPGMSGGAVLDSAGKLVGIHAAAERDDEISDKTGKLVATGINQAVPINYFMMWSRGRSYKAKPKDNLNYSDYYALAASRLGVKGKQKELLEYSTKLIEFMPTSSSYFYRATARAALGDTKGAKRDYQQAISINPAKKETYKILLPIEVWRENSYKIKRKFGKCIYDWDGNMIGPNVHLVPTDCGGTAMRWLLAVNCLTGKVAMYSARDGLLDEWRDPEYGREHWPRDEKSMVDARCGA